MKKSFYSERYRIGISENPLNLSSEDNLKSYACQEDDIIEFEELKTYFVKFFSGIPEYLDSLRKAKIIFKDFPENLFSINFSNMVGLTRIGPLKIKVINKKISEDLYHAMLDYITDRYANLIFSFDTPLGETYKKEKPDRDIAYIEYLFIKRYLIDSSPNLDQIAATIRSNPHMKIHSEYLIAPIDEISTVTPSSILRTIINSDLFVPLSESHFLLTTGMGRSLKLKLSRNVFPSRVYVQHTHHTVDTPENRFIKFFLNNINQKIDNFSQYLRGGTYLNPDIEDNLTELRRKINRFLKDPVWEAVGTMTFIPANSQVLQKREGYRQLFRLYFLLQLSTRIDFNTNDFKNLIEVKDTPTLFEYWAFFNIKEILDEKLNGPIVCRTFINDDPKELTVYEGISLDYDKGISLWYIKSFGGSQSVDPEDSFIVSKKPNESYSHTMKPDIIISKNNEHLIFDAKYKGERDGFYGEGTDGTISSPKDEDIDKMHTYHDAIRNVVGAFILYPGDKALLFPSHGAKKRYQGVGAFPLKPEVGGIPSTQHIADLSTIIGEFINEN